MWNKITNRILFGYSIPILFLIVLSGVIYSTTTRSFKLQEDAKQTERNVKNAAEATDGVTRMIGGIRGYLIFPGDQYYVGVYKAGHETFIQKSKALENITEPKTRERVNQFTQVGENYHEISQNIFRFVDANNLEAAKAEVSKQRIAKLIEVRDQLIQELESQLNKDNEEVNKSQQFVLGLLIAGTIVTLIATLIVGLWISLPLRRQLPKVVDAAEGIADGDLTQTIEVTQDQSEIGQLLAAFQNMTKSLNLLITQVQKSGIQITTSTTQIAAAGRQLEATITEQAASTNEVSATSQEIAATSGKLAKTMDNIADKAQATATAASQSQADLMQMATAMRQLAQATTSISSKLGVMNEKANNINSVVTTITKVADQTNLLSLNAAIEAEKAGEYGAGFSVVAREIRRLADQTAVATLEIEQMVKEMQSSVSTGVMEMDKFNNQVSHHVEQVSKISGQIALVSEQVQSLTPDFEEVSDRMDRQFEGAQQISVAIAQLSEASHQSVASLQETNKALEQLDDAAQGLQGVVYKFKV